MHGFESLLILMVVVWGMGKIFRMISLPIIFGELLGGIIVGPMVLGVIDPGDPTIKILAELGVFFLMLHAGLETDPKELMKGSGKAIVIGLSGLILPLVSCYFVARAFGLDSTQAIFIGIAISATSISMCVRILKDYKMQNTNVGHLILSASIVSDIAILIAFSTMLNILEVGGFSITTFFWLLLKISFFFAVVLLGGFKVQKYINKFFKNKGFTLTLVMALGLGLLAEFIGLHVIIGAFLAGLFIREEIIDEKIFAKIEDRIYGLSYSFLGPIFFTSLAFSLTVSGLLNYKGLFMALFFVAFLTKWLSTGFSAYFQKISKKDSVLTGLIMNGRGAIDLIIISIGLELSIIDQDIFSVLVALTFAITLVTILLIKPVQWKRQNL